MHTETAIAATDIPFGSPVSVINGKAHPCPPHQMHGIAKRPAQPYYDSHYGRGETIRYQTNGECLAVIQNQPEWVVLRGGRIVKA